MQTLRRSEIQVDGFEDMPVLRRELLAFIDEFCAHMTLAQAREWFEDAFLNKP
ncbi:MAG TPA: hypothetical protein VGZ02_09445 [Candidatus Baltobacteraceae bacterium]|jgi:hypothetical protein|nr:hypothetical protein [Candidatus Baltobacteraceae bacterium]